MSDGQSKELAPPLGDAPKATRIGKVDPAQALYNDALDEAHRLKRKHRGYYYRDTDAFRKTVKKAHGKVFRLKPGPKEDPRIAVAARERATGAQWESLYPKHIDHYSGMPDFTRDLAEAGFRKKVNANIQTHPALRRKIGKRTQAQKSN